MNEQANTSIPTPSLSYAPPPPGSGDRTLGEPAWALQHDAFSFDATRFLMPAVPYFVRRSSWRRGTVTVTENGAVVEGPAVDMQGILARISSCLSVVWLVLWCLPWQWTYGVGISRQFIPLVFIRLILATVTLLVSLTLSIIVEYRRSIVQEDIAWDRVLLVQFDRTGLVATLIYEVPAVRQGKKSVRTALQMRLEGRGEAADFRAALQRRFPERIEEASWRGYWSKSRIVVASVFVAVFGGFLIWAFAAGTP